MTTLQSSGSPREIKTMAGHYQRVSKGQQRLLMNNRSDPNMRTLQPDVERAASST